MEQDVAANSPAFSISAGAYRLDSIRAASEPVNRENYAHYDDNAVKRVREHPVSTFSIDVDTGSYANIRRMINTGRLPAHDAVRAEELINYFSYDYPVHAAKSDPFVLYKEIAVTPWNAHTHLLHIGIKAYDLPTDKLPPANLVFLVDVSGSMQSPNKLELLKSSLKLLTAQLSADDSVSIVVYAGASGVVLEPTAGDQKGKITAALEQLTAGGSTNGGSGIKLAYAMAEQAFIKGGINRVLLATDGDFNVGTVNIEQLKNLVEEKRKTGIALSTLGFGTGNYNDHLMEQIANIGNGNYAYIDTLNEAQKVLVDEMSSTMLTIARDVKLQIEFNPAVVTEYRLIGYENRKLNRQDFNNDKVDAGEIGAGHTVTAIYEISLVGSKAVKMDPLRYQSQAKTASYNDELALLRLRYKKPDGDTSKLLEWTITKDEIIADRRMTSNAFRFSAAVAGFAQALRGGIQMGDFSYADIMKLAQASRGDDPFGYRGEFLSLVNMAGSLTVAQQAIQHNAQLAN
ncbi:MAG: VWA domain-containing protein [Proteobacteria bacterium]|nr:VWA domain-containing protein [Pseudomonadota bacterium]